MAQINRTNNNQANSSANRRDAQSDNDLRAEFLDRLKEMVKKEKKRQPGGPDENNIGVAANSGVSILPSQIMTTGDARGQKMLEGEQQLAQALFTENKEGGKDAQNKAAGLSSSMPAELTVSTDLAETEPDAQLKNGLKGMEAQLDASANESVAMLKKAAANIDTSANAATLKKEASNIDAATSSASMIPAQAMPFASKVLEMPVASQTFSAPHSSHSSLPDAAQTSLLNQAQVAANSAASNASSNLIYRFNKWGNGSAASVTVEMQVSETGVQSAILQPSSAEVEQRLNAHLAASDHPNRWRIEGDGQQQNRPAQNQSDTDEGAAS